MKDEKTKRDEKIRWKCFDYIDRDRCLSLNRLIRKNFQQEANRFDADRCLFIVSKRTFANVGNFFN